jgi:HK97 gp10 family phage protein
VTNGTRVEVDGATQLASSLRRVSDDLDDLDMAEARAGQYVRQRASSLAPKLTGALSQSIRADTGGVGVAIGSDLVYAGVQEFGSAAKGIRAQPFLRPAAEDTAWVQFYEDEVQRKLATVKGA